MVVAIGMIVMSNSRMESAEISETTRWKVVAARDHFERLRKQESFWGVVALGRAVNALRFVQMPLIANENDDSPAGARTRYNSLLFAFALLAESVLLVNKLGKYFGRLPKFRVLSKELLSLSGTAKDVRCHANGFDIT